VKLSGRKTSLLSNFLANALRSNQTFAIFIQVLRVILLSFYLVAGARLLGPAGYGELATTAALTAIGACLVGLGSGIGLVRISSRNIAAFPKVWGECIASHFISSLVVLCIYLACANKFFPELWLSNVLIYIGVAEIIFVPLILAVGYAFMANELYRLGSLIQIFPAVARFLSAIILLMVFDTVSVESFAIVVMLSVLICFALAFILAYFFLPAPLFPGIKRVYWTGYSVVYASSNLLNNISSEADKIFVYRLTSADQAGIYSAVMRIVVAVATPFGAIIQSKSHYLFSLGDGISSRHIKFLQNYAIIFFIYGAISGIFIFVVSPYVGALLGARFSGAENILAIISLWIPVNGFRQLFGGLLTTADRAWYRSFGDIISTIVFAVSASVLVPICGLEGAIAARLAAEIIGLLVMIIIFFRSKRDSV